MNRSDKEFTEKLSKKELGKHKVKNVIRTNTIFDSFKEEYNINISKEEFKTVCLEFNRYVADKILYENFEYMLPFKLGSLRIKKFQQRIELDKETGKLNTKRLRIDYAATWDLRYKNFPGLSRKEIIKIMREQNLPKNLVYHYNEHTEGYVYRWYWDKSNCNILNNSIYLFRPTKENRLAIAPIIRNKERNFDYFM